jgi:hypothetical protein
MGRALIGARPIALNRSTFGNVTFAFAKIRMPDLTGDLRFRTAVLRPEFRHAGCGGRYSG